MSTRRTQVQQQLALIEVLLRGSIYSTTLSANSVTPSHYSVGAGLRYREPRVFTYEFEASQTSNPETSLQNLVSGITDDELDTVLHDIHGVIASYLTDRSTPSSELNRVLHRMRDHQEVQEIPDIQKPTEKKKLGVDIDLD